ncbi:MAG UNVERIFIED_CONTAM: transposase [Microcystis novacekii LVE1205-3]
MLPFVVWKRGKYYLKVDKNGTSQDCPNCGAFTAEKSLSERVHQCDSCVTSNQRYGISKGNREPRKDAVGLTVLENACGGGRLGVVQLNLFDLVKSL